MQISITGRHMNVTDALRAHAEDRLRSRLADFPRLLRAEVVLSVEKHRHIAEVVVHVPHHGLVESKRESADMYLSIDQAVDHVAQQLRKWYDRKHDHKARASHAGEPGSPAAQ